MDDASHLFVILNFIYDYDNLTCPTDELKMLPTGLEAMLNVRKWGACSKTLAQLDSFRRLD